MRCRHLAIYNALEVCDCATVEGDLIGQPATTGSLIGYVRVPDENRDARLQINALKSVRCFRFFVDRVSASATDWPELGAALEYVRPGDTLCVQSLDRLGRSSAHIAQTIIDLANRGVALRSLADELDTTTSCGLSTLGVLGALAKAERARIREGESESAGQSGERA